MKYKKGQQVIVKSTKQLKTVEEFEIICDVEIYYMNDKSSYSLEQIEVLNLSDEDKLVLKIIENQEKIKEYFNVDKISEKFAEGYKKMFNKSS